MIILYIPFQKPDQNFTLSAYWQSF